MGANRVLETDLTQPLHTSAVANRRRKIGNMFLRFLMILGLSIDLLAREPLTLAEVVVAYGRGCFRNQLPQYIFSETINIIQDWFPVLKPTMSGPWRIAKRWARLEPSKRRAIIPPALLRAAICVAILLGWMHFAGICALAFATLAHPSEVLGVSRSGLVLPRDLLFDDPQMPRLGLLDVGEPKTKFSGPRRQHAKFQGNVLLQFIDWVFGDLRPHEPLYPFKSNAFRNRWNHIFNRILGVSVYSKEGGVTPGCLRGSGATYMYLMGQSIETITWLGRWRNIQNVAYYVQENAGLLTAVLQPLNDGQKDLVRMFSSALEDVIWAAQVLPPSCRSAASILAAAANRRK